MKWWLLAIPQYIIVGLFAGGGTWAAWRLGSHDFNWGGGGLIGILVLIAADRDSPSPAGIPSRSSTSSSASTAGCSGSRPTQA